MAFNDSYATSAIASQSDFTNLFPGFDERAIIAAADRVAGIGDENLDAAYTTLFGFSDAVHANGADFTLGSSFTLVSFSSGLPLELAPRTPPLRA